MATMHTLIHVEFVVVPPGVMVTAMSSSSFVTALTAVSTLIAPMARHAFTIFAFITCRFLVKTLIDVRLGCIIIIVQVLSLHPSRQLL